MVICKIALFLLCKHVSDNLVKMIIFKSQSKTS